MIDVTELVGIMFSGLSALVIDDIEDAGDVIVLRARTRGGAAACPGCSAETSRVHGYYERTAADVPADGRRVVVKVRARRMRCPGLDCPVQTFREQVSGVLDNRRTEGVNTKTKMIKRQSVRTRRLRTAPASHSPRMRLHTVTTETATEPLTTQTPLPRTELRTRAAGPGRLRMRPADSRIRRRGIRR
jgi:transposase IS204/IS1001/IS1096/IS1165 family protein